jgi:hypothetical protein
MNIDFDEHFERQMDSLFKDRGDVDVITPGGTTSKLLALLCRHKNKYGIYISYTPPHDIEEDEISDHLDENIEELGLLNSKSDMLKSELTIGLLLRGWTLITFDEEEEMRDCYSKIPEQNVDVPFYACTIHKKGVILNENT